tara:strand:- start:1192 stop:1377 length:186 start_codon:yes stop_codon:yes gene_type:complete
MPLTTEEVEEIAGDFYKLARDIVNAKRRLDKKGEKFTKKIVRRYAGQALKIATKLAIDALD